MAKIYPGDLGSISNKGESRFLEALRDQLDDSWSVYWSQNYLSTIGPRDTLQFGEIDFVISHPKIGIFVVEVKGSTLSAVSGGRIWQTMTKEGWVDLKESPVQQAQRNRRGLIRLWNDRYPGERSPFFNLLLVFTEMSEKSGIAELPDMDRDIVAFEEDLGSLISKLTTAASAQNELPGPTQSQLKKLHHLLDMKTRLDATLNSQIKHIESTIKECDQEQIEIAQKLWAAKQLKIVGGPGTGKTVLAVHRACELANSGMRTLLTCYNDSIAQYLREKTSEIEWLTDVGRENLFVENFHNLHKVNEIGDIEWERREAFKSGTTREFFEYEYPSLVKMAMEMEYCSGAGDSIQFDAIIVDEGQDLRKHWIELLEETFLKDKKEGYLYFFYDDTQSIQNTKFLTPLINSLPEIQLTKNYRNTKQISKFMQNFDPNPLILRDPQGANGPEVEIIACDSKEERDEMILQRLKQLKEKDGLTMNQMAILTPSTPTKEFTYWNSQSRVGNYDVGFDYESSKKNLALMSIRRFKGLEKQVVILSGLSSPRSEMDRLKLMFTGLSRAKSQVIIIDTNQALEDWGLGLGDGVNRIASSDY